MAVTYGFGSIFCRGIYNLLTYSIIVVLLLKSVNSEEIFSRSDEIKYHVFLDELLPEVQKIF